MADCCASTEGIVEEKKFGIWSMKMVLTDCFNVLYRLIRVNIFLIIDKTFHLFILKQREQRAGSIPELSLSNSNHLAV